MTLLSGSGTGKYLLANPSILRSHRMVNKSMRCAAMRLRSAAAGETGSPEAADVSSSASSATLPAAVAAAGARGDESEIMSLSSYTLASPTVRPTRRRRKPRKSQIWLNRSRLSRLLEARLSLADRRDIFDHPTSPTLRLRDGVVLPKAR